MTNRKIAFLFPGQGAQYVGMGKDFLSYPIVRQTFEEADDFLRLPLSKIIFDGPENILTETRNSQPAIYVLSVALLRLLKQLFPQLTPTICAGLSLGEYSALYAAEKVSFLNGLNVVRWRSLYMNDACEKNAGTMAVVLGMDAESVENAVKEINLPNELWAANFNCPGQVVISGTRQGIATGTTYLQTKGAKRVLPLNVHGAFHSGLMRSAEEALAPYIDSLVLQESPVDLVMNVVGDVVKDPFQIRKNLIKQICSPVRWEQSIRTIHALNIDLFIEIGCGKTLAGFNKRMNIALPTINLERVEDLTPLELIQ